MPIRRTPVQERSNDTVQQILRAASNLLCIMPLEQITTSRIANEAGVSVGGLYRFFPDKQAILDAIAVKAVGEFQGIVERSLSEVQPVDGRALLALMIDAYVRFLDGHPDFRTIALGRHVSALTREKQVEGGAGPAGLVKMFLMGGEDSTGLKLRIAIETGERLIDFAFSQPEPTDRERIIAEMKGLLAGYLFGES